jgi:hypothetical protein
MFSKNKQGSNKRQSPRFKERFKGRTSVMPSQGITQLVRQRSIPIEKAASPQSSYTKQFPERQPVRALR